MGAQTAFFPNTLHGPKQYWPFAVHTRVFSSGNRAKCGSPPKINRKKWGLLGCRHVQTSLENIVFLVSLGF